MSEASGGHTSDKFLTEKCGFLNNLVPGDLVLADQGFTVHEEVWFCQVEVNIPAFTKGKNQLDPLEVEKTRKIANVRIHVEHVIGVLRQKYTILQSTLPTDFLTSNQENQILLIDRIVKVCSALVNLCPPIVPFDLRVQYSCGGFLSFGTSFVIFNVCFQKISIPSPRMVFWFEPSHPLWNFQFCVIQYMYLP